jgi:HSP20 family protein
MSVRDLIPWRSRSPESRSNQDPFFALHDQMNRLFDDFARGFDMPAPRGTQNMSWPSIDVDENDEEFCVEAELPGMKESDVEVTLHENVLSIRGEKRAEESDAKRQYRERYFGQFERRMALPAEVDQDAVTAKFENGVLKLRLPKAKNEQRRSRRIPITAEGQQSSDVQQSRSSGRTSSDATGQSATGAAQTNQQH